MTLELRLDILRRTTLFATVPEEDMRTLAEAMTEEQFAAGDILCRRGDHADRIFILVTGLLAIEDQRNRGGTIWLRPGALLGEYGMFDEDGLRTATVTVNQDAMLLSLDYRQFRAFLRLFPDAMYAILSATVRQLLESQREG